MLEQDVIPYHPSKLPEGPWLILSPHPDDETIGLGGSIALSREKVWVVMVTDGSKGGDPSQRKKEADTAAKLLGIDRLIWWDIPDREVSNNQQVFVQNLPELIKAFAPKTIFLPSPFEFHPDHRFTTKWAIECLKKINCQGEIWLYEISRQGEVNRLIDITPVASLKQKAIKVYHSQIAQRPYDEVALALNRARSYTLENKVEYAEGFWASKDIQDLQQIQDRIKCYLEDKSYLLPQTDYTPLVSIIIRTKDRPELLKEALQSLAAQSYKKIEAIVVNDGGEDVADIVYSFKNKIYQVKYIYHEKNIGRAAAANSGLFSAAGEWIGLLDDDDILLPEAISTLISSGMAAGAVYGQVEAVLYKDRQGNSQILSMFGTPFSREALFLNNYIPTCGFLFKKKFALKIDGFDTGFYRLEDWDFIYRLAQETEFNFVPQKVAIYRLFNRGFILDRNNLKESPWREKFYKKHINKLTSKSLTYGVYDFLNIIELQQQFILEKESTNFIREKQELTEQLNFLKKEKHELIEEISLLKKEKHALIEQNNYLSNTINEVFSSKSWRLTDPFRRFGNIIKRSLKNNLVVCGIETLRKKGVNTFFIKVINYFFRIKNSSKFVKQPIIKTEISDKNNNEPLNLTKELIINFTSRLDRLNKIAIFTLTYNKRKKVNLELSIVIDGEQKRKLIHHKVLDNDYTIFSFPAIDNCKGKLVTIKLKSIGEHSAGVWFNKYKSSHYFEVFYNNRKIDGSVGIRVYHDIKIKNDYELWMIRNEPLEIELKQLSKEIRNFKYRPKISIIMPTWNTDQKWLKKAIESVINQIYPNWELCIADGSSTNPEVKKVLEEYSEKDQRIKIKFLPENLGIAGNSNEALKLATGEFIGLLDHDDELAPFALYEVCKLLNKDSDLDFIYSDEDKIDKNNKRKDPFFKPDYVPDMFLSCNYICHFSIIRKSIIDKIGGFRKGYDGSQDYDIFLRVLECTDKIAHIPKILYHWRMIETSAASSNAAKPYAYIAAKKSLTDAMNRRGIKIDGVYDGIWTGSYRIKYNIENNPRVSIIIPNKDNMQVLQKCINSILEKTKYNNYQVIVVENSSSTNSIFEYYNEIEKHPKIQVLYYKKPFNYSAISNYAVSMVDSEFILFLNNDTEVMSSEWLSAMVEHIQRKEVGVVGAKLLYPNNKIQHAGLILGTMGIPPVVGHAFRNLPDHTINYFGMVDVVRNYSAVTGACMLTKKSLFEEVGGFDEKNLPIAFNDVDYCLKLRKKNFLIVYTPYAVLYHYESVSRGYEDTIEKKQRLFREADYMRKKWGEILDNDPYYNPNLTKEKEDFSIQI